MSSPLCHRWWAVAALAGLSALAAGCSTGSPGATPVTTVTVPASASASTSSPPPVPSTTPASPTAPAGPLACPTRSLQVKLGLSQGAAGSTYQVIDFTNISNVTCTLYGYPGVSLASSNPPAQVGPAAAENPTTPRQLVTLAPGGVANALLRLVHAADFPTSICGPKMANWMVIYPPNQTTPVPLKYSTLTCTKKVTMTVNVVQPGSGG